LLEPGKASSYLLDAAELTEDIEDTVFNGSYYYGIHVDSQLISPDNSEEFLPGGDSRLEAFLTGIKNNSMNESGTTNPRYEVDSPPSDFNFDTMLPGRVFTMAGEEYLYLEDMGNGNHMIIRHEAIRGTSFDEQPQVLADFYAGLAPAVQTIVQPVTLPEEVPGLMIAHFMQDQDPENSFWLPVEWEEATRFDTARADRTVVNSSGTPQAFALSMADVVHLSTETGPFPNYARRVAARDSWWWLRTSVISGRDAWHVHWGIRAGQLHGGIQAATQDAANGGVRPALIINPSN
ncbi:hypothetical protein ACI1TM_09720, partial [Lactococcus garvieae]